MDIRCTVLGAGSWGTTVAHLLAHNTPTTLWARDPKVAAEVDEQHTNERYLPGAELHPALRATDDMGEAVAAADLLVMGVPSHGFRQALTDARAHLRPWVPVISLAKGLEQGTRLRMTEVIKEVVPGHPYGILTGPNLAREILAGDAAASVLAMSDDTIADRLQALFCNDLFRVYTNPDVIGCELGGALKNVIAIASGMADGLGTGDNTRAAVITRGLAEMARLGTAMGGHIVTFGGLAGLGDLLATCISPQSRNRHVGEQLGRGRSIDEIIDEMHMVAEGVKSAPVVRSLADDHGIEMPIVDEVYSVLYEGRPAAEAYRGLLNRKYVAEMHGMRPRRSS
jgi:glycerol-3-phosphate dehydrogenase (NAD(P)+)